MANIDIKTTMDTLMDFDLSGVVAIAAGGTHIAVLLEDGRVVVRGDNAFGQCDTAGWSLAAAE